jgi:pilus assembly protein CpaF
MNTGLEGSMSTVHANSPNDAIGRLEAMVLMAGTDLPSRAIQKQIASAVDVIIQAQRVRGGARKIVSIYEITGLSNGETQMQELFQFRQIGVDDDGNVVGFHTATGNRSVHMDHFAERAEFLSLSMFEPNGQVPGALA